jgi:hypothetical protein
MPTDKTLPFIWRLLCTRFARNDIKNRHNYCGGSFLLLLQLHQQLTVLICIRWIDQQNLIDGNHCLFFATNR